MKFSVEQYATALMEAVQDSSPKDHDKVIDNFIKVLQENNDLDRYEEIVTAYEELDRARRGVRKAELTFARQTEVNKGLIDTLNAVAQSQVEVRTSTDPSLVGGVVIRIDDTLIDASVKGQLNKLKDQLSK